MPTTEIQIPETEERMDEFLRQPKNLNDIPVLIGADNRMRCNILYRHRAPFLNRTFCQLEENAKQSEVSLIRITINDENCTVVIHNRTMERFFQSLTYISSGKYNSTLWLNTGHEYYVAKPGADFARILQETQITVPYTEGESLEIKTLSIPFGQLMNVIMLNTITSGEIPGSLVDQNPDLINEIRHHSEAIENQFYEMQKQLALHNLIAVFPKGYDDGKIREYTDKIAELALDLNQKLSQAAPASVENDTTLDDMLVLQCRAGTQTMILPISLLLPLFATYLQEVCDIHKAKAAKARRENYYERIAEKINTQLRNNPKLLEMEIKTKMTKKLIYTLIPSTIRGWQYEDLIPQYRIVPLRQVRATEEEKKAVEKLREQLRSCDVTPELTEKLLGEWQESFSKLSPYLEKVAPSKKEVAAPTEHDGAPASKVDAAVTSGSEVSSNEKEDDRTSSILTKASPQRHPLKARCVIQ